MTKAGSFISRLRNSGFAGNSGKLIVGTVLAQSIPLLLHPWLRRIYTPEDFGAMAVYLSLFGMVTIVACFRLETAIVLPESDEKAANLLAASVFSSFILNLVLVGVCVFWGSELLSASGLNLAYAWLLWLLPLAAFLFSTFQAMNYWLIRKKRFLESSANKVTRRISEGIGQVSLSGWAGGVGLFAGDLIGNLVNWIAGIYQIIRNGFQTSAVSISGMKQVVKEYSDYPIYNALPTLLSSIAALAPVLFINSRFTQEITGYVDLSRLVLSVPLIFIATSVAQVLYSHTATIVRERGSLIPVMMGLAALLITVLVAEAIVLYTVGDELFSLFFGEQYLVSSQFSRILFLSFACNFVTSTFSALYNVLQSVRWYAIWQCAYFGFIMLLTAGNFTDIEEFLFGWVVVETIAHGVNIAMILFLVMGYERNR